MKPETITCPHCGTPVEITLAAAAAVLSAKGSSKGGKTTGASKSRSSEQMRAAALARWNKRKAGA